MNWNHVFIGAAMGAAVLGSSLTGHAQEQGQVEAALVSVKTYLLVSPDELQLPPKDAHWTVVQEHTKKQSQELIQVVPRSEVDPSLVLETAGLRLYVATRDALEAYKRLLQRKEEAQYLIRSLLNYRGAETGIEPDTIPVRGRKGSKLGKKGMVLIKEGEVVRPGKYYRYQEEKAMEGDKYTVRVSSFYMDKYEVTNEDYCRFLNDGNEGYWTPTPWGHQIQKDEKGRFVIAERDREGKPRPDYPKMPAADVSYYQAKGYAEWAHKRLPTEAEWEYAAGGKEARTYPWGDEEPDKTRTGFGGPILPVGSFPKGQTPEGVFDLLGNVTEWCADRYSEDYYRKAPPHNLLVDPQGPPSGYSRMTRGGCTGMKMVVTTRHERWPLLTAG